MGTWTDSEYNVVAISADGVFRYSLGGVTPMFTGEWRWEGAALIASERGNPQSHMCELTMAEDRGSISGKCRFVLGLWLPVQYWRQ